MQGRGRGQLSFHRAQPVTAPSTVATVTYDDPNGSWESWEPGASWNGTGGAGQSQQPSQQPGPQPRSSTTPHAQPSKTEGLRWEEDDDTNLRHPANPKQLPGTLITMSELDWEDTEELATELWRHPMRPRISRDPHVRADAQRLPVRSPVRPDPRQLPMPLPGPGGARPHARSEEPTARVRVSGANGLARTSVQPRAPRDIRETRETRELRVPRESRATPPQRLPAPPPPRPELQHEGHTARGADAAYRGDLPHTAHAARAGNEANAAQPAYAAHEGHATHAPYAAHGNAAHASHAARGIHAAHATQAASAAGEPRSRTTTQPGAAHHARDAHDAHDAHNAHDATTASYLDFSEAEDTSSTAMPADWLDESPAPYALAAYASPPPAADRLPAAPVPQPTAAGYHARGAALVPPPPAGPSSFPPPARGLDATVTGYAAHHSTQMPRRGSLIQTQAAGFAPPAQLPPAPPPRPSLPAEPMHATGFAPPAQLPPAPPPRPSLPAEPMQSTITAGFAAGFQPPAQLPPAPAARPSLPAEPITRTQAFEAPAAARIESLRERTLTPPRLLPPPPRFQSSAHIPTIIGTPTAATFAPVSRRPEPQHSLMQSGARLQPRASGRDVIMGPPPREHAQSQLIEQLQEQLLEAMARARVQEARAAEAEKSAEQAEEQLAAFARGNSEESEQLQQQLMQLSEQLRATEARAFEAERRPRQPDNMLHLIDADLAPRPNKQSRANLVLSGLLASSLSFGGAAYFMFYAPLQKQLVGVEQLRTQDSQAHATAVSNLQARSNAEKQGLEAQNADLRKQLEAAKAEATAAASAADEGRHGRGRRASAGADADSTDGTPAGTRSARAIERRMRRSHAAQGDEDEAPKSRKSSPARGGRGDDNDPLGGM